MGEKKGGGGYIWDGEPFSFSGLVFGISRTFVVVLLHSNASFFL